MMCSHGENCLLDGHSPYIDTTLVNWASDLVTVRKNKPTDDIGYDHVVLTFSFDEDVKLKGIEIDFFLCLEWGIHAPYISIYGSDNSEFTAANSDFIVNYEPSNISRCGLSTVVISIDRGASLHSIWHIVVSFGPLPDTEWVHVGEVRFPKIKGITLTSATVIRVEPPQGKTTINFSLFITFNFGLCLSR